jgi:transcriptional regulator with XRE-family HTH domain
LAKWETDRAYPDVNIIKELADLFEVTTDYLLGWKEDGLAARIAEALKQNKGLLTK